MAKRSTMKAIHLMIQMMGYNRARKIDLHIVFIDLKIAYDKISREVLWWIMTKKGISKKYKNIVQDKYREYDKYLNLQQKIFQSQLTFIKVRP